MDANDFKRVNQIYEKTINTFSQLEEGYVRNSLISYFNCYENKPTIKAIGSFHVNSYETDWTKDFGMYITLFKKILSFLERYAPSSCKYVIIEQLMQHCNKIIFFPTFQTITF